MRINDKKVHRDIGAFLREARLKKNMEQKQVAAKIGLGQAQYISNVENGKAAVSIKSLRKLVKHYGISKQQVSKMIGKSIEKYYLEQLR
jgi:transcriptional regulator with XRE-family HTH domain